MTLLEKFGGDRQKLSEHMRQIAKEGWRNNPDRRPATGFHKMPKEIVSEIGKKGGTISRRRKKS